jgi:hypothetical protein
MEELIHMTATYSNALFVAILPHVSDFGKKLELPVPQPITTSSVSRFNPNPYKGHLAGTVVLTNRYWFWYDQKGYVEGFTTPSNIFTAQEEFLENVENYAGQTRMTTNEIIAFARETLLKLGYTPEISRAGTAPELQGPRDMKQGGHIPYCRVAWRFEHPRDFSDVHLDINTQDKTLVGLYLGFARTNKIGTPLKLDVEPESESEYRRRIQGTMFARSNAPPRPDWRISPQAR